MKDLIIRGGENIGPGHIEACLLEHPDVRETAVVLGLPHHDLGEEVGAIVSLVHGATTTVDDLDAFVQSRLAHFEVPTRWWLREDELPKNDAGKVVKYRIRDDWMSRLQPQGVSTPIQVITAETS